MSAQKAKEWFEANAPGQGLVLKSDAESSGMLVIPDWEQSFPKNDKQYETAETALLSEKAFNYLTPESHEEYKRSKNSLVKESVTRLVIRSDKNTGETDGFFMTIVPDLAYTKSTKYTPFRDMTYLVRDPKFSGYVMYHDLNGWFVNGWKYIDGIASYTITPADPSEQTFNVQTKSGCYAVYMVYSVSTCGSWITSGDYTGTDCYTSIESEYMFSICPYSGGGGGGGGSGGYDGGQAIGGQHANSVVNKVLANSHLDEEGYLRFRNALLELLRHCGYQTMYNYAVSRNKTISNLMIAGDKDGQYSSGTKIIKFKNNSTISSYTVSEEFIHFFQDMYYPFGASYYPKPNIEFEAQVLRDVMGIINDSGTSYLGKGETNLNSYIQWIYYLTDLSQSGRTIDREVLLKKDSRWGNKNYWDFMNDYKNHNFPTNNFNPDFHPAALGFLSLNKFINC